MTFSAQRRTPLLSRFTSGILAAVMVATPTVAYGATGVAGDDFVGTGPTNPDSDLILMLEDEGASPAVQGWEQSSINYWISKVNGELGQVPSTISGGGLGTENASQTFNRVCRDALDQATTRGASQGATRSRVVGIYFTYANQSLQWSISGGQYNPGPLFQGQWNNEKKHLQGADPNGDYTQLETRARSMANSHPDKSAFFDCYALNDAEPPSTFTPTVTTEATDVINKGAAFSDAVTVNVARNSGETQAEANTRWMDDTTLIPHVSVRGPFSTAPTSIPAASTEVASFDCPGFAYARTRTCSGGSAPSSGYYYYHVTIPKHDNTTAAVSAAFDADEITLVRMQPRVQTTVGTATSDKYVNKGSTVTDTVTFGLVDSLDEWITGTSVTARGRLYGPYSVAGAPNPTAAASNVTSTTINNVPSGSGTPVCTVSLTRTSAGTSTSPGCTVASSGYYTWVWDIQDAANFHTNIDPRCRLSVRPADCGEDRQRRTQRQRVQIVHTFTRSHSSLSRARAQWRGRNHFRFLTLKLKRVDNIYATTLKITHVARGHNETSC
ncbi:MAG: hypothetical protein LBH13_10200 [Cellulomonadaceae bacterium]|nr:hypothetical protein [Cellulomonadaceae bacterium]